MMSGQWIFATYKLLFVVLFGKCTLPQVAIFGFLFFNFLILWSNISKALINSKDSRYLGQEGIWCADAFCLPIAFLKATCVGSKFLDT